MTRTERAGIGTSIAALVFIGLLGVGGYAAYYGYSTRNNGGASYSGFQVTLTTRTTHIVVPKGEVLVTIPQGINSNTQLGFEPASVRVVLGVNSTILFYNADTTEHIIESVQWPANATPISLWLVQGDNGTVTLNQTGTYVYNFEINPAAQNGTITVVSPS